MEQEAIVLRLTPFRDADLVVQLLCRGQGRVAAYARGARKSVRRFAGVLEPFSLLAVQLESGRGELSLLSSALVREPFRGLRSNLAALAQAGYAAELARELTREHEPADALLDLSIAFLRLLDRGPATAGELRALELAALAAAGLAPELSVCARCGGPLIGEMLRFDPAAGGATCWTCASEACLRITCENVNSLRELQSGGLAAGGRSLPDAPALRAAVRGFLTHHLGRRMKSVKLMEQLGADS